MSTYASEDSLILEYALGFIGTPYIWGGAGPIGFDCSGLIVELLKARGWVGSKFDATAHMLFEMTHDGATLKPRTGALAFYGRGGRITHVGFCITDELMIEAGGGRSTTLTPELAEKHGAFVRIRPIYYRSDFISVHIPKKEHFKKS